VGWIERKKSLVAAILEELPYIDDYYLWNLVQVLRLKPGENPLVLLVWVMVVGVTIIKEPRAFCS
jgi:hypothetical protein